MTRTVKKTLTLALCILIALCAGFSVIESGKIFSARATDETSGSGMTTAAPIFTVIDGTDGYKDIYDGDNESKLCISIKSNPYITFRASDVYAIVTGYKLYTGNDTKPDHMGRNPKAWKLQGSIDGANWTDIHTVTDDDKLSTLDNLAGASYTFENAAPYLYYKITFTERQGETGENATEANDYNLMQISEIEFTATISDAVEIDTEEKLANAFANGGKVKLTADIELNAALSVDKKVVELDLNGHVISGKNLSVLGAAAASGSVLILKDSNPKARHADANLPVGGVVVSELHLTRNTEDETWANKAILYANGGTVVSQLKIDTASAQVDYYGNTMTTFIEGVYGSGATINAGFYYGSVISTNTERPYITSNKKVEFKIGDKVHATQYLRSGDKAMIPPAPTVAPEEGLTYIGWYTHGGIVNNAEKEITDDTTYYAIWMKEVRSATELSEAIAAGYGAKLAVDFTFSTDIALATSGKIFVFDLNGHVITSSDKDKIRLRATGANKATPTEIIIIDSDPTAIHEGTTYPVGGYINAAINMDASWTNKEVKIYANGGTISYVYTNSGGGQIYSTSSTPSVFLGVGTSGNITVGGGTYYNTKNMQAAIERLSGTVVTYMDGETLYAKSSTSAKTLDAPIAPTKEGYSFVGWYITDAESGVKSAYDFSTLLTKSITLTAEWVDSAAPVIKGIEGDKVYCTSQEVTVTDDSSFTVTVDGTEVTLVDGKFTLDMASGVNKTIVAVDEENNEVTLVVKYGHNFGVWTEKTDEDCSNDGTLGHKDCNDCHAHFDANGEKLESLTIPASHSYGDVTYVWAVDNSTCTATCLCSRDDSHVETETVSATSSVTQAQSCTNVELTTYVATFKSSVFVAQTKADVQTKEAAGHSFGELVGEVAATEESEGVKEHKDCSVCGKHFDKDGVELESLVIAKLPESGLSGGAVAGIVVGGIVVLGGGGFSIFWFVIKKKKWADLVALFAKK